MTTTTTTTTSTSVPVPAGTPKLPWSVKGRGKSATYCAALPAGKGTPGQRVALVAQSGAVTFAVLTTVRETVDNVTRWDFDRDTERMTADVKAANRAAKAAGTAAYWSSPAGLQTAERIAARQAAKAAGTPAPAADLVPETVPETVAPAPAADMIAATVAALVAAGASPEIIAATVAALETSTPAPAASAPAPAPRQAAPRQAAPAADLVPEKCDACNRDRKGVAPHQGAPDLLVCPRCAPLDADTARIRAARHQK